MKKILYCTLSLAILAAVACKNNDATTQKIDFTQSYENAALALTSAQNNYNAALATNDTAKINKARTELQTATTNYVSSKNDLIKSGGTVKQAYESNLTTSEQTLSKTPAIVPVAASTIATKVDSATGGKVGQALNKLSSAHSAANNTLDKANNTIQTQKAKAQENIKNTKAQYDKSVQEAKKLKDDVGNLFKN